MHYFSETPQSHAERVEYQISIADSRYVLESESGVFSSHGLDRGTAVLLDWVQRTTLPIVTPQSTLLDMGCGGGPIAITMATLYPECIVYAIDVNERARQLCRDNVERNNVTNVVVAHPDEVPEDMQFAMLWSNPPIRIGKEALHALLLQWMTRLLSPSTSFLVVNKNLGADSLAPWLTQHGFPTSKLASSKGFRILEVSVR